MNEKEKEVEFPQPMPKPTTKCPWCGEVVPQEGYENHIMMSHYKEEGGKLIGPFPALVDR